MTRQFALLAFFLGTTLAAQEPDGYVKKATRTATVRALHAANKLHDLGGDWHHLGPFDNSDRKGFDTVYPPQTAVDLKAKYKGKNDDEISWKIFDAPPLGRFIDFMALYPTAPTNAVVFLYHEHTAEKAQTIPVSFGSDDTLTVWANGERLVHEDVQRDAAPGQARIEWKLKPGKNTLLIKICQYAGDWRGYVAPELSPSLPDALRRKLDKDFPNEIPVPSYRPADADREAKHYRIVSISEPKECVLEVGGLGFRPDGKLLAAIRRGELWLIHNPLDEKNHKFTRYASGLHEPLGIHVENDNEFFVIQRSELTKVIDRNKDNVADEFQTAAGGWGVSGGYHEYAFGPAKDKDGNFFVTLNVNFSAGGFAPVPWRGWCVKLTPDGKMEPWCYGLRSPNGVNFSPDGELFYCDNQGEWVATNKLNHLKKGKFYGHQSGLIWLKDSPFSKNATSVKSGMLYDGQPGPNGAKGKPDVDPPAIWFPYGRMGQSASEMRWDTTAGKFGPFAGQCFVGDQTRSCVMRVALEKVNDVWQGACFPFRGGLQCGVNRLAFAPDGSLFAGQTARGWGSVGNKQQGLQRLVYTGVLPFEILTMKITKEGFDLTVTKPVDPKSVTAQAFALKSFTYVYHSTYGSPEMDAKGEKISAVKISGDGLCVSLVVPNRVPGRVYELRAEISSRAGESLLHPDSYYTLNSLPDR